MTESSSIDTAPSPETPPPKSRLRGILRLAVTVGLFALVVLHVGDDAIFDSLARASRNVWMLAAALIFPPALGFVISTLRLRLLLAAQDIHLPHKDVLRALLIGTYFNQLLPTSVGGDAYLVLLVGRRVDRLAAVFSAVVVGRVLGMLAMCVLILTAVGTHPQWFGQIVGLEYCVAGVAGIGVLACVFLLAVRPASTEPGSEWYGLKRKVHRATTALARFRESPRSLLIALGLSTLLQFNVVVHYWFFGKCLGIELGILEAMLAVPLVSLAAMMPITFNGLGVREWVMIWVCLPLGVAKADAAVVAWLFVFGGLIFAAVGAYLFTRRTPSNETDRSAFEKGTEERRQGT